jgi:hypothetical protein
MPLQLHQHLKVRLTELLAQAIGVMTADHGMFLDRRSGLLQLFAAEEALPQHGELHDRLISYIDYFPLTDFVYDTIGRELRELDKFLGDVSSINLVEIEGYRDTSAVATRLVALFDSLPWEYQITFELPEQLASMLPATVQNYQLNPQIRIVRPDAEFTEEYPLTTDPPERARRIHLQGASLLDLGGLGSLGVLGAATRDPAEWNSARLQVQINAPGFSGLYGGRQPEMQAEQMVRAFCGLGIAVQLFEFEKKYSPVPVPSHFYVHRRLNDDTWQLENKLLLSERTARARDGLKSNTLDFDTEEKRAAWDTWKLDQIRTVFSSRTKGTPLLLAAQWFLESQTGSDELLNYVQAMVVLEILLGEQAVSEEIGIGSLIGNRCAYLIGNTNQQRAEILRNFSNIYRVRSQIVHRGKQSLTPEEFHLFRDLSWMCRRVIQKEVDLLVAESKSST